MPPRAAPSSPWGPNPAKAISAASRPDGGTIPSTALHQPTGESRSRGDSAPALAPLLGVLATLIAAAWSWVPSIWYDEAASLSGAHRTLRQLWLMMHHIDAVHGVYYAGLHFWTSAFGSSGLALRLPSAIAVGVATSGVWTLVRLFGDRRFATAAACCFMILPRATWMGMEGRSFAVATAVAVWSTVLVVKLVRCPRPQPWGWLGYGALGGVGIAVNVYLALLAPVHLVAILVCATGRRRGPIVRFGTAWVLAVVVSAPVLRLVVGQAGQLPSAGQKWRSCINQVLLTQYFAGALPTVQRLAPWPPAPKLWSWACVLLAIVGWALAVAGVAALGRQRNRRVQLLAVSLAWLVIPLGLVLAYGMGPSMYAPRYFCFTAPAMAIVIAGGITSLPRPGSIVALVLVAALALPIYLAQRGPTGKQASDWAEVARYVAAGKQSGDALYPGWGATPVIAAYPDSFAGLPQPGRLQTAASAGRLWDVVSGTGLRFQVPDLVDSLWLIENRASRRGQAMGDAADARLRQLGFVDVARWSGPSTSAEHWVRRTVARMFRTAVAGERSSSDRYSPG